MKRLITFLLGMLSMSMAFAFSGSGSGTSADPYLVTSLAQLNEVRNNLTAYYKQTADIDALETSTWNGGAGWATIGDDMGDFTGIYDGQGHTITKLYVNRPARDYVGLFGSITGATIKNLGLINASVSGNTYVGALVGYSYSATSHISNCFSTGTISGISNIGGLIGYTDNGTGNLTVNNCYSHCSINGASSVGGFIGTINNQASISNCYSKGTVSGSTDIGGFIGTNSSKGYGVVTNCFWDTQTSGQSSSPDGTGKTTTEMTNSSTFTNAGWDFTGETTNGTNDYWNRADDKNSAYPYLSWQSFSSSGGATELNSVELSKITCYPNPTKGIVYLKEASKNTNIKVYNAQSQLIIQTKGNQIDLSEFANGIYLLDADGVKTKVIKE